VNSKRSHPPVEHYRENRIFRRFFEYLKNYPHLEEKLYRQLLILLHSRNIVKIDQIYTEAQQLARDILQHQQSRSGGGQIITPDERVLVHQVTLKYAVQHLTEEDINQVASLTLRRDASQALEDILSLPDVSFRLLAKKLEEYCNLPGSEYPLPPAEAMGIRVALIRHFISDQLEFIGVAKKHLKICDMLPIVKNAIGPKTGIGKIGGKAAGMYLAYRILSDALEEERPRHFNWRLNIPESYYLRSDLYQEFIHSNGLTQFYDEKYKSIDEIRRDYPLIKEMFRSATFPEKIVHKLRKLLKRIGPHPLIVRSSSLLEDNFGSAFSGKYDSVFLPNQGTIDENLEALLQAVAEVYASTLGPDPILYRRERNLIDYDERMAVLIQKVVGIRHGDYFLPIYSGVGFSRNEYRWNRRIRKEDGLVRLVVGLGTRAVDRVSEDYPRMVALSAPTLRPEASIFSIQKYSQRFVDVINLKTNRFETIPFADLIRHSPLPELDQLVSVRKDGTLMPPIGSLIDAAPEDLVVTFEKLLSQTPFAENMKWILKTLEKAYGSTVDVEFAYDGECFYILQCRPQSKILEQQRVRIPEDIPDHLKIFSAKKDAPNGLVKNIEYIVYVDPIDYDRIPTYEEKSTLGRIISKLDGVLARKTYILMGPGRWGSNDINLGIPVRYGDFHNTSVLIEIARAKGDYIPEVSFGTHFFQDLVEAGIYYLPLYPDEPGVIFNEAFLRGSPNVLPELLPEYSKYARYLRVIHVPRAANGYYLHLAMDGEEDRALAYLGPKVPEAVEASAPLPGQQGRP